MGEKKILAGSIVNPEVPPSSLTSEYEEWLTTEEAASYLKISKRFLLNLTSNGRIPYCKFGRSNRYLQSELRQLLLAESRGGSYGNQIR